ncbi:MAG: response regulator [Bacteroidaceae bacterium]
MIRKATSKPLWQAVLACMVIFNMACNEPKEKETDEQQEQLSDSLVSLRNRGKNLRNEGRFDEALLLHNNGLTLAKSIGDTCEWIQALNNIGTDYRRMGLLDIAQEYHYEAWRMCEESSDTSRTMKKNRVVSLNGLGNIYLTVKDYTRADSAFQMALAGEQELGSATGQAINYANIGAIYNARGDYKEARRYYEMSMMMNERDSNTLGMSLCHTYFGNLHEKAYEYTQARQEYMTAYQLIKDSRDRWHALEPMMAIVRLELDAGNMEDAERWLQEVDQEVKSLNSREHESEIYTLHYKINRSKGLYREALNWYEKAVAMEDSIMDQDKNNRIHNIGISIERRRQGMILEMTKSELRAEKNRSLFWLWGAVIVAVVFVIVVGLLLYIQRLKSASMRLMQETSRMREDFFTNITHEFRTPLTVILGLSEEMKTHTDNEEWKSKCEAIYRQGNSLLRLVTQLLDMAKIKSKVGVPDWRHGNIVAQVKMIAETFRDYAANKGIDLSVQASGPIEMDFVPDYINKVMGNLLSNAIKFTRPNGKITIEMTSNGRRLTIDVSDTGKGMSQVVMKNIFKPFYSASAGNCGTGVGLALVKQIADTLEGSISVKSIEGSGSTFTFVLPIRKSAHEIKLLPPEDLNKEQVRSEAMAELDKGNCTETDIHEKEQDDTMEEQMRKVVLVVEDNRDVAEYIGSQLSADYDVVYAINGEDGLQKATSLVPDIIVSDMMMPEMNGLEMCRRIRENEVVNHIPVIMVTAKITEEDKLQGLEAGVDVYMPKPFNADELRIRVEKLQEMRRMLRQKYMEAQAEGRKMAEIKLSEDEMQSMKTMEKTDAFLNKITEQICSMLRNYQLVSVATLSENLGMNARQLHRKLTAVAGTTPNAYIQNVKIDKAKKMLEADSTIPLKNVALDCGFIDYSHFAKVFKSIVGQSASEYAKGKGQP